MAERPEKTTQQMLREPFPEEIVGKLPRITCRDCRQAGGKVCNKHQKSKCAECGAWITGAHMHLDYVGHAAVTDRLLQVDPKWNWEPMALDEHGAPLVQARGNTCRMWIKLTIDGVTRLGVGTCGANKDEAEKELIGDAIRNAAMRFGVALDLWSKENLAAEDETEKPKPAEGTEALVDDFEAKLEMSESATEIRALGKGIAAAVLEFNLTDEQTEYLRGVMKARLEAVAA